MYLIWRFILIALLAFFFLFNSFSFAQTVMFDYFNYTNVADPQLPIFNKWEIVDGINGPPSNAVYSKNNIQFLDDPAQAGNRIMTLRI